MGREETDIQNSTLQIETIQKAMKGDKEAFSLLFLKTYHRMYFVARTILYNDEDIYDALQIGYTKAYKYITRLSSAEAFFSWLKKIIENAAKDVYAEAAKNRAFFYEEHEAELCEADKTEESERRADVFEVLSRMDSKQAEVMILYFYDGMKLSEIARLLGEPQSTIRSRFGAGKKELIQLLKVKGIDSSLYGGSVSAMIAMSLQSLIGTDMLSAVRAQQMLDDILQSERKIAAYHFFEKQRNKAVLRAVSLLMALTVAVTCVTAIIVFEVKGTGAKRSEGILSDGSQEKPKDSETLLPGGKPGQKDDVPEQTPEQTPEHEKDTTKEEGADKKGNRPDTNQKDDNGLNSDSGETPPASSNNEDVPTDSFVPDYRPGKANTAMRSPNNLSRNGLIDEQDEWMYLVRPGMHTLEKVRKNGTNNTVLLESTKEIAALNVIGDWIYYVEISGGIYRIRTDGSGRERLAAGNCCKTAYFIDNSLYYGVLKASNSGDIYRYDIGSGKKELILSDISFSRLFYAETFYMTERGILYFTDSSFKLFSLSDRQSRTIISNFPDGRPEDILIEGNYVYCSKQKNIMRVDYTAQNPQPEYIYQGKQANPEDRVQLEFLNLTDHVLGFTEQDGFLYLLNTETQESRKADFKPQDVFHYDSGRKIGYYVFEPGWVWGLAPSGAWARVSYRGFDYAEY